MCVKDLSQGLIVTFANKSFSFIRALHGMQCI
jgi:hypothetical protein